MGFRAITAQLVLRTALHVGTGNSTEAVDDLIRRDARGRILIPGTALAGSLRAIATRLAPRLGSAVCQSLQGGNFGEPCECLTCKLFGDVNPQRDPTKGVASRVIVFDAPLEEEPELVIRDGVGIDRVSGAAARKERLKFDLEVVPAGTTFALRIELDPNLEDDERMELLAATLAEWEAGRGAVGGRVGRGLGALELRDIRYREPALNDFDKVVAFLKSGPDWTASQGQSDWVEQWTGQARQRVQRWTAASTMDSGDNKASTIPVARSWVVAEFILAAEGPFLINDPVRAGQGGFDHAMLRAVYRRDGTPILPGSSLRGVLRSQAERIARTLATYEAWGENERTNEQRQALFAAHCPACNPLTTAATDPVASCNSFIRSLTIKERQTLDESGADDKLCLACRLFGSPWNGSRLRVEDASLIPGTGQQKVLDFLAIDRFTGGGLDGAKFDAVALWKPQFQVRLFLENPENWELGWLALTLRDLHEGLATVGFGAAKGFGRMTIQSPHLTFGLLDAGDFPDLPPANDSTVVQETVEKAAAARRRLLNEERQISGLYQTVGYSKSNKADWLALAEGWVQAFHRVRKEHERKDGFRLQKDSYFTQVGDDWLSDLYPLEVV